MKLDLAALSVKKRLYRMTQRLITNNRGFTLVEALVGTALFVVVFMGIFGAYRLSLKVVQMSKNKITATAIANSRIEMVRNLFYESVGTVGAVLPAAAGGLEPVEVQTINDVTYTITTEVNYVIDPADGTGAADSCNWDYKKVDINISWGLGEVGFSTNVSPKNLVQEIQTCLNQPGGVLKVTVFDSSGIAVPSPTIEIYDQAGANLIDSAIPSSGEYLFALEVGTYRVEVSKSSYSHARSYDTSEVAVPDSPNPAILDGGLTPLSLSIDPAAEISIGSISPTGMDYFADPFDDGTHISDLYRAQVISGSLTLSGPVYPADGDALSEAVAPADIVAWNELIFTDSTPAATNVTYQILYYDGLDWVLVPDLDLAGNSSGLSDSPVNLSSVDKDVYPQLKLKANLESSDSGSTPAVLGWEITWTTSAGAAVPDVGFNLQGAKTIGKDAAGQPVYKYSQDLVLDGAGHIDIVDMDEDNYTFGVDPASGFSLVSTDPAPQPVNAASGYATEVKIFLRAQNALLATVQDDLTLAPVFSAAVRIHSDTSGYDNTLYTNAHGQMYFAPLDNGNYDVEISASGYEAYLGAVTVSGESVELFNIHHQE